jgi:prevent-host-death family protein
MSTVAVRELRNSTAQVIERVRMGEAVTLTSRGEQIARIEPLAGHKHPFLSPTDVLGIPQADAGLRDDLAALGGDSTDELGAIR